MQKIYKLHPLEVKEREKSVIKVTIHRDTFGLEAVDFFLSRKKDVWTASVLSDKL